MEKKQYKSIVVDIDNTLTELQYTVDSVTRAHGREPLTEEDIFDFNFKNVLGVSDEEDQKFWDEHEQEIVENVPYMKDRVDKIKEYLDLDYLEEIYIVSNRPRDLEENTRQWLEDNGIEYTILEIIGKDNKAKVVADKYAHADAIFEDNPEVIEGIMNNPDLQRMETWLIDYAYNRRASADYVIASDTGEILNR